MCPTPIYSINITCSVYMPPSFIQCIYVRHNIGIVIYIIGSDTTYKCYIHFTNLHDPIGCCKYEADVLEEVGCPTSCPDDLEVFKYKNGKCLCIVNPCKVRDEKDKYNMSLR